MQTKLSDNQNDSVFEYAVSAAMLGECTPYLIFNAALLRVEFIPQMPDTFDYWGPIEEINILDAKTISYYSNRTEKTILN